MTNYLATLISSNGANEVTLVRDNAYGSPRCRARKHCDSTTILSSSTHEVSDGDETDTSSSCSSTLSVDLASPPPSLPEELQNKNPSKDLQLNRREEDRSMILQNYLMAGLIGKPQSTTPNLQSEQNQQSENDRPSLIDMLDEIQDVLSSSSKYDDSQWTTQTSSAVRPQLSSRTYGSNAA